MPPALTGVNNKTISFQYVTEPNSGKFLLPHRLRKGCMPDAHCYIEISGFPLPMVL